MSIIYAGKKILMFYINLQNKKKNFHFSFEHCWSHFKEQ